MGSKYSITKPKSYDQEVSYLDAEIRGDGSLVLNGRKIEISDKDLRMHEEILVPKIKKVFGLTLHVHKKGNGWTSQIKSKELFDYLTKILKIPSGEKSEILTLPQIVFETPDVEIQKNHLRGWMDAEGNIKYKLNKVVVTPRLSLGVKSKNVRDGLVKLIKILEKKLNSEFPVWTWKSKDGIYHFEFAGPKSVINYMKLIGLSHPSKKVRIESLINNYFSATAKARGANLP